MAEQRRRGDGESSITFLQQQHAQVLQGLHQEISKLQHKCSDLQFALASSLGSVKAEHELKKQLERVQHQSNDQEEELFCLRESVLVKDEELKDLREQLKWIQLDFQNQITSKDGKIEQLQRRLSVQSEVDKLQNQCKQLYEENKSLCHDKMNDVVKRAKAPNGKRRSSVKDLDESHVVITPVMRSLPDPITTRSKVFRHKLQGMASNSSNNNFNASNDSFNGSHSYASLPNNYKASVATLPPIVARSNSVVAPKESMDELTEIEVSVLANCGSKSAKERSRESGGAREESFA